MEEELDHLRCWFSSVDTGNPRVVVLAGQHQLTAFRVYCSTAARRVVEIGVGDLEDLARVWCRAIPAQALAERCWPIVEGFFGLDRIEIETRVRTMSPLEVARSGAMGVASEREGLALLAIRSQVTANPIDWVTASPLTPGQLIAHIGALLGSQSPALVVHGASAASDDGSLSCAQAVTLASRFASASRSTVVAVASSVATLGDYFKSAPESAAKALARQGRLPLPPGAPAGRPGPALRQRRAGVGRTGQAGPRRLEGGICSADLSAARSQAEASLFAALEADLRTAMQFELNGALPFDFGGRPAEVDLACRAVRLAVEVDGYHHFIDAEAYRRDRRKDRMLQLNGWLVFRVLADDLNDGADIDHVVDQIAETITRMKGDNQRT